MYDVKTGLEWNVGPYDSTTWDNAKEWAENLSLDGGGWRLATREELESLYIEGSGTRNMPPLFQTKGGGFGLVR